LIDGNVAAITVFVGYGVADLALEVTQVLLVLGVAVSAGPDILMAVVALHHVQILIPGSYGLVRTVEFLTVAFGTGHGLPGPVNVTRDSLILPEILSANTGAVTGHAVILGGWSLAELMFIKKTAAHLLRAADMALTTGSVALLTMILKGYG